ncbi:hypothetical protein TrLO_g4506 [Triparma laevis f. longispina]|uniref:Cytochrome b-c1 complex subunit 8 n=1 Tax=Triparma laevis f. longispina TaxID=1714387 RepID=A0A9W6ZRE9_9STRA|nr:hypothetical protein TrLO_g4506 [Triparma laevis f. longispina]
MSFRASSVLAFRASSSLRAGKPRNDVPLAMSKWWGSYKAQDGVVTQQLSPYEQQAIMPWVRTWPKRLMTKFTSTALDWVPPFVLMIGLVEWSEWKHSDIAHHHRD